MSRFFQLHMLTPFPPSNPNRDDLGRPKTAEYGGCTRMRISSQALKRAMRTSPVFAQDLAAYRGVRTQRFGEEVEAYCLEKLGDGKEATKDATKIARAIADIFAKVKAEKDAHPTRTEQLAFISPAEKARSFALVDRVLAGEDLKVIKKEDILLRADSALDIAMFGRMMAKEPSFNWDAAVQVAHAITVNRVEVESDYYSAVDDLNSHDEDAGAGFIGDLGFSSGLFYLYACINLDLLVKNLDGDDALARKGIAAFVKAMATATPTGKVTSFAHNPRAIYALGELGDIQPRNLSAAFLKPVGGTDMAQNAIQSLRDFRKGLSQAYGETFDGVAEMEVGNGGTLEDVAALGRSGLIGESSMQEQTKITIEA